MQGRGEREVAEVVGRELQLDALRRALQGRQRHHPGVVDEDVERAVPLEAGERGEVEAADVRAAEVGRDALAGGGVADGERDVGAGALERAGGLDPDPGGAAGDDRALAVRSMPATTSAAVDSKEKGVVMRVTLSSLRRAAAALKRSLHLGVTHPGSAA